MKFIPLRDESGQTLLLTVISMLVLIGFAGLAIDIALAAHLQRLTQTAADAAASAAALDYRYNGSVSNAQSVGQAASTANGVTNLVNNASVAVNCPPTSGPDVGAGSCNSFFEAIVSQPSPTYFMSAFGFRNITVSGRGVAGFSRAGGCVYALSSGSSAINISSGSAYINATSCSIYDNGGLSLSGGSYIKANSINVVGSTSLTGSSSTTPSVTKISTFADPLKTLPAPTVPSPCTATITNGTYSQGCYASVNVSAGNSVTFGSGTYVITGNFTVSGGGIVNGSGVTFYLAGSNSKVTFSGGSASSSLTAPTTGVYHGVLFFQNANDSQTFTFSGGSGTSIQGIIYVPDALLTFTGASGGTFRTDLVSNTLTISGGSTLSNYAVVDPGSVLAQVVTVE